MKSESFDFKRIFVVFSFILVFVLIAAFVFVYFTPKNEESAESFSEASDPVSSASEVSVPSAKDTSDTLLDIRKQNEEKMLAGGISSYSPKNLIEWYCTNMLREYGTLSEPSDLPIAMAQLLFYEDFSAYLAVSRVSFTNGSETRDYYINLVMGAERNAAGYYYLIDGFLTEQPSMRYDIRNSWEKIKKHAVFGKHIGDFPQETRSNGIQELPLFQYIGEDRNIFDSVWVSEDTVAILNADFTLQNNRYYSDWKIDFVNLNDPGQNVSHPLAIDGFALLSYNYCSKDEDSISLYFEFFSEADKNKRLEYKVKIGASTNDKDIINILEPDEVHRYISSESGRYYVYIEEENLYLRDTLTNKDILVFEATWEQNIYTYASPAFFVGETLYYNIHLFEQDVNIGSYNPDTNEKKLYQNKMHAMFYCNGYIYGWSDETDGEKSGLNRFSLKNPEKVEYLLEHNATMFPSPDEMFILRFEARFNDQNKYESAVTVYNADDFKALKTYTFSSVCSYFNDGIVFGDKLFIPVISNVYDSSAFIIDLQGLKS